MEEAIGDLFQIIFLKIFMDSKGEFIPSQYSSYNKNAKGQTYVIISEGEQNGALNIPHECK